jgi:hypothetical protein
MARWYEGGEEAAFKPVAGGYIFQPPSPYWPFASSGGYMVNEAQKSELATCLRRQRRRVLLLLVAYVLIVTALMVAGDLSGAAARMPGFQPIAIVTATALAAIPIVILPHIFLMRSLRPLLAGLTHTDERITIGDRLESLAAAISGKLLWLGGIGGGMMLVGNLVSVIEAVAEDRGGSKLYLALFGLLCGALLTSYFVYLALLKSKLKRSTN